MNKSGVYKSLEEIKLDPDRFHTTIHSQKYHTLDQFYSLIARRMHFPEYFGNNLDAFEECMTDLDWINEKQIVIEFRDSENLLKEESSKTRSTIWHIIKDACNFWKQKDLELIVIKA